MLPKILILSALVLCAYGQAEEANPAPEPYSFTFESPNEDGSSSARSETGDSEGRITGFYIIKGLDGQDRRVDYVADENGFRAEVSTSESGTESHEAANALYRSSAPSVASLIADWASSGAAQASAGRRKESSSSTSSSSSSRRTSSFLTQNRPVVTKVIETPQPQVTPEGYVLVPASAARTAGIEAVGPEITTLKGFNRISGFGGSSRTITESQPQTTSTRTRFRSGVTGGVTGSTLFATANTRK